MLAGQRAQIEQPRLDRVEPRRVHRQRLACALQQLFRLCRLDHRPVKSRQRAREQLMLAADPVQPPRRLAQLGERPFRSAEQRIERRHVLGQPRALLHRRAFARERLLLARLRREAGQFGDGMGKIVPLPGRAVERFARRRQPALRLLPGRMCRAHRAGIEPAERIEQVHVPARIEQAALIMLAVDLHQPGAHVPQQCRRAGLIVEEGAAPAVRLQRPPDEQRLARLLRDAVLIQQPRQRRSGRRRIESRGHARLIRARAHQPAVRPHAERQPQRIEQDRLARARLPREHGQPALEGKVERLDEHDVADGEAREHDQRRPSPARLRLSRGTCGSGCVDQFRAGTIFRCRQGAWRV